MIKTLIQKLFRKMGFQVVRIPQNPVISSDADRHSRTVDLSPFRDRIARDPLNALLHFEYGIAALKENRPYLAYAELKTAECLGIEKEKSETPKQTVLASLPRPECQNHNQYFRFRSLSAEILKRSQNKNVSVLDVGGGQGELAAFIPETAYCLADPNVNGISGTDLPFSDRSFDYVVSCHVLEHIPLKKREIFLDQLLSKCRLGVILLGPFYLEGTHVEDRLQLFLEVTAAQWARDHLECTLPKIDDLKNYARQRDLEFEVQPNGTLTTSTAMVFVDHFAGLAGRDEEWKKVNRFFNLKMKDILDSQKYLNAYLIYLGRSGSKSLSRNRR